MNDHGGYDVASEEPVARSPRARRNALLTLGALILLAVAIWALTRGSAGGDDAATGGKGGAGGRPTATVGVAKAVAADVPRSLAAIGTVTPIVVATVRPQLAGNIFTINFTEGQVVAKGQLLAQIDPRPYALALQQAQANLQRDTSQLNLARIDLKRYQTLLAQDSIARQQVDTQAATVKQNEGIAGADQAAIGTAKLNLHYTSIVAPVAGRAGLRQADIGNYVTPGDANGIVVITQTAPIDVAFSVPQANLPAILAARRGGATLPVVATDQAGTTELAHGGFLTFDNQIDATTGTVKAKARFSNGDGRLFPNQFVNVSLRVETLHNVATVPVTAIRHGAQGDFVFLLQPDKTVKLRVVQIGPAVGTNVAVLRGVAVGQTVITEGADNLDDGSKVALPGDKRPARPAKKTGFLARLFGGGSNADNAAAANVADGNSADGTKRHRHRQGGGDAG